MKVNLRNRCVVLKALAVIGPADAESLHNHISDDSDLTIEQVRRAIYTLLEDDEIEKLEQMQRKGSHGRPAFVYAVRDTEKENRKPKKAAAKKGRKSYGESLRSTPKGKINTAMSLILHRDRKIRLIKKLMKYVDGPEKDLIIGILADFGCDYIEANRP